MLRRASEPFLTVIGALDAIHLATALLWSSETGSPLTLVTHDKQFARAARAAGIGVAFS